MLFENFRLKFVEGCDGLGHRTGEEGGCRVWPVAQGRELAAGPSFSCVASSFTIVIHLQRLTLGKGSP